MRVCIDPYFWLKAPLALAFSASLLTAETETDSSATQSEAIPWSEIGAKATADYSGESQPFLSEDRVPEGLAKSDWKGIREAYEAGRHAFVSDGSGWKAPNPSQQWITHFDGRGFLTSPHHGEWTWGLELVSYGVGEHQRLATATPEVAIGDQRMTYQWDDTLQEWWINDQRGLEHGFIIGQRPPGSESADLSFTLATHGGLEPHISASALGVSFQDADEAPVLNYSGLKVWDADGKFLKTRFEAGEGNQFKIVVEDRGANYPITIDPIAQQAYLKAGNTGAGDFFGWSVAVSGDTVVVGAPGEDSNSTGVGGDGSDNSASFSGAAYVFVRSVGAWSQQAYLKADNTGAGDSFGLSVAVSGDTVAVGASNEDSNATGVDGDGSDNSVIDSGAAYIFVRSGGTWSQQAYLKAGNADADDKFGDSVAISGDVVVVGAPGEDSNSTGVNGDRSDNSSNDSGAAHVFVRNGGAWSEQAYLKAGNTGASDQFGASLAVSGETVVVGALLENSSATGVNGDDSDNNANDSGAAYVFVRSGSAWSQQAYLKAGNTGAGDQFGRSVAASGDTVVVGAELEDGNTAGVNGDGSDNSVSNSGAAYVFVRSGSTWSQESYLKAGNTGGSDQFGRSVAANGDTIVVGAFVEKSNATGVNGDSSDNSASSSGAAYVFVRSGGAWSQQAYLKADNTGAGDTLGLSVAVSGNTAVVGAPSEDSNATGVDGDGSDNSESDSGAAYIFTGLGPALPDLAVDVSAPATATAGVPFDYTITARNIGALDASDVGVTFTVPAGLTVNSVTTASGFTRQGTGNSSVVYTGGSLPEDTIATLTVSVTSAGAGTYSTVSGSAMIDPSNTITESNEDNNNSTQVISTGVSAPSEFAYTTANGEITITDYLGSGITVNVPTTFEGLPVTVIGNNAFRDKTNIRAVTLPASITSIEATAFRGCQNLTSINFPAGLTSIGDSAFFICNDLDNIILPDGLTSIGNSAFNACRSLSSITIPDSVETIGLSAFNTCSSLTQITLPSGLTVLEANVLKSCSGLTSITIPESVLEIKSGALSFCSGLTSIAIPGNVDTIGARAFQNCTNLSNITLPVGLSSLGIDVFTSCSALTAITIPSGITSIPARAFNGCSALTEVVLPANLTNINNQAFNSCSSLAEIVIPDGVTTIGTSTFGGCSSLTSITLPASVTSIGISAFEDCSALTRATFLGDAPSMGSAVFDGSAAGFTVYFTNGSTGFTTPTWLGYPSAASAGPTITSHPASQTIISGETATMTVSASGSPPPTFQWYLGVSGDTSNPISGATESTYTTPALTSNTSYWVQASNSGGPAANSNTATVTVATQPSPIAHWKFDETDGATAVDSAGSYDGALSGSASFVAGGISGNAINLLNAGNSLVNMGNKVPGFTSGDFTIVTWIKTTATNGDAIFAGKHLSGNSSGYLLGVNTLGGGGAANKAAFYPSGQGANIPFSTTTVNDGTWHQVVGVFTAGGNAEIYVDGVLEATRASPTMAGNTAAFLIGGITIASTPSNQYEGLVDDVQLYPSALSQSDISFLFTHPGQKISATDFSYEEADGEVTITGYSGGGGTVYIPSTIGGLPVTAIGSNAFQNNGTVTSVSIPEGVTDIGISAFSGCSNLAEISLPTSLVQIDDDAFRNCSSLTAISLPFNLERVGNNAFRSCSLLTGIVFPATVDDIGFNAFRSCIGLTSAIFFGDAPSQMSDQAFFGTANEFTVYFFAGSTGFTTPTWLGYPAVELPSTSFAVPEIVSHPEGKTIASGTSTFLFVAASGNPPPQYQWYVGNSGDVSQPVGGATSAVLTTPNLNSSTSYWVRATNSEGTVDSDTATVTVEAGTNANLASLVIDSGTLSPGFNQLTVSYSATVPNSTTGIGITPTAVDPGASVKVNGFNLGTGVDSIALALAEGLNQIEVEVTSANLSVTKTYTLTVLRNELPTITTDPATNATPSSVVLNGTVDPNGSTEVYFEYGATTSYGNTTPLQSVSGNDPLQFQATVSGLPSATTVNYRAVVLDGGVPLFGQNRIAATLPPSLIVVTGNPVVTDTTEATLVGAVNTRGLEAEVYFEYGTTLAYGNSTTPQTIPAGSGIQDIFQDVTGLIAGANYHVRLVISSPASFLGNDVQFEVEVVGGSGTGSPTDVPTVTTGEVVNILDDAGTLKGTVNSNGGTTTAYFEYGTTTAYGQLTEVQAVGNDTLDAEVSIPAVNLLPGTTYYYRILAENSQGISSPGDQASFTTQFSPPTVTTGDAEALTTTSVRISGTVRARNADTDVEIIFGTNPKSLSDGVATSPALVTGNALTTVTVDLENLLQSVTYYYQVRAVNSGGTTLGTIRAFRVTTLSGILQVFPEELLTEDHQGSLQVNISPPGIGAGWRLSGEQEWRLPGDSMTGMASGDRVIEYRPASGYIQPSGETLTITSGDPTAVLDRSYTASGATGSGGLTVTLKPDTTADQANPVDSRTQWRLIGETDLDWKNSGATVTGLVPGNHVVECKPVAGRSTPPPASVVISDGVTTSATLTYYEADTGPGSLPGVLAFETITTSENLPYAFVGQIRSDVGSSTGFVVRPRVVATAAHVVFDDGTLTSATGLQWLFQRHRETHEPTPLIPRGFYTMTGYAAQREADNSPGISTPESQHLDASAMYFTEAAGRSGFSGYLASDLDDNEFLLSSNIKTLVGYPVENISATDRDRMHATTPSDISFTRPPEQTRTFTTQDIRSAGGSSGGPICVLAENGKFYPAAIYLGGTGQTVVRAIDSEVATLFGFAEISGNSADGTGSGSITDSQTSPVGTPTLGSLSVIIEPAGARIAGAGWRINSGSYLASGTQIDNLDPNSYGIEFATVPGFENPATPSVDIVAGELKTVTFTYEIIVPPPVITSAAQVVVNRGDALLYETTATNSPDMFSLSGLLPLGTVFDPATGRVTGVPQEAGKFEVVVGVSNLGGTDTKMVDIISLPLISPQSVNAPYEQPLTYRIVSSETEEGAVFEATNLPPGLVLNESTGEISGTPTTAGTYDSPISVTVNEASQSSVLTFEITGTPPSITTQPPANIAVEYGANVVLSIEIDGLPAPSIQWYRGISGDTSEPVDGKSGTTFASDPLTSSTNFWARVTNLSGSVDSNTSAVQVLPSTNANLSFLSMGQATFSPPFSPGATSYSTSIPNSVANVRLTPNTAVPVSTVEINGTPSPINTLSSPIPISVGTNTVVVTVTAQDGVTTKDYTLSITRAPSPAVITLGSDGINDISATVRGSVNPNGSGMVIFEYGPSTNYGSRTPPQQVTGTSPVAVSAALFGLSGSSTYHYRVGFNDGGSPVFGQDMTFTTAASRPLVVTGNAVGISETGAILIGLVNPRGTQTDVHFEYGTDPNALGNSTAVQDIGSGTNVVEVTAGLTGLTSGVTYYYRAIAESAAFAQPVVGEVKQFVAETTADVGDGLADSPPNIISGSETATSIDEDGAVLEVTVNPNDGSTVVYFEYGTTLAYGFQSEAFRIGNGTQNALVTIPVENLETGVTYFFRTVAENAMGVVTGTGSSFTTSFLNPTVETGQASAISTRSARVYGTVQPNGTSRDVYFRYGTDGINFPQSVRAFQQTVDGSTETSVYVDLVNLDEGVTYFYKLVATDTGEADGTEGDVVSFNPSVLVGFIRQDARILPASERQGQVTVNLLPSGTGNWRLSGEQAWRVSGETATGLTVGDRTIEFRPVQGFIQPPSELITISDVTSPLAIERFYYESASTGSGSLQVTLLPTSLSDEGLPRSGSAQWRLAADADQTWKDSGQQITGLLAGIYLIECKPLSGWDTPVLTSVNVEAGADSSASITYFEATTPAGSPPLVVPFETAALSLGVGYAHVGQIRSQSGSYSGFAVKPRVVATVAQAVFDEATLTTVTGLQWLLQRDEGNHEPKPLEPRGSYFFTGYDAQRTSENTPGELSLDSQDLNVAALYFLEDAGRGGFSGYLGSNENDNEFLISADQKILAGYPVNQGRMFATASNTASFTLSQGKVFTNSAIRGTGGMAGGPLCVQYQGGDYYPAGIYLGGANEGLVRAIDSLTIDLFTRAEVSGNGGDNNTGGGITQTSIAGNLNETQSGSLQVIIEPAGANSMGAAWQLVPESNLRQSGAQKGGLTPGTYSLDFSTVPGFFIPSSQTVTVTGGQLTTVTFTYEEGATELDSWRYENFQTYNNTGDFADDQDPDRDGVSNIDEFTADTDPNSAADFFHLETAIKSGSTFTVSCAGKAGRIYTLQRNTGLSGMWTPLSSVGPLATDGPVSLPDTSAPAGTSFYRIEVSRP